ncbi:MAG: DUF1566 domain-containing protein, partial [Polyangiales bacterium]
SESSRATTSATVPIAGVTRRELAMRAVVFLLSVIGVLSGCSDPPCAEGERKVGSVCLDLEDDGGAAGLDGGATELDAAAESNDALPGRTNSGADAVDGGPSVPSRVDYACSVAGQCAEWPMPDENGKAKPSYAIREDVVEDRVTKLVWQRSAARDNCKGADAGACAIHEAARYCADLSLGGRADWRLPSVVEIQSTFALYRVENSLLVSNLFSDRAGNGDSLWASSSIGGVYGDLLQLRDGRVSTTSDRLGYARCVAGGERKSLGRYTVNVHSNTVTDNWTTLDWQRFQEDGLYAFEDAKIRCATLGEGWRLPTAKELLTLISPVPHGLCIDLEVFPPPLERELWSSTEQQRTYLPSGTSSVSRLALTIDVNARERCGQLGEYSLTSNYRLGVRCVR